MNGETYICFLCFLLNIIVTVFASDIESHVCYPAINRTQHYYYTNISISLDTDLFKEILTKNSSKCIFEFQLRNRGAIYIEYNKIELHRYRTCRIISSITFKIDKEGLPVKKLNCWDTGQWVVSWPWNKVVVEINLTLDVTLTYPQTQSTVNMRVFVGNFQRLMSQRYRTYRGLISMPTFGDKIPVYCLGDYYYEISYSENFFKNSYNRNAERMRKVKFLLVHRSVCIRTHSVGSSVIESKCRWRVHLSIGNEVLMVLRCIGTYDYWCLPKEWIKKSRQLLEISFESVDNSTLAPSYSIKITTNESYASYGQHKCPYETTTATVTTTRSTNDAYEDYWSYRRPNVVTYLIPIAAVLIMVVVCICFASYVKSKRTSRQRRMQHHRIQMAYTPTDSGQTVPNPVYRTHDPVMDPAALENDESTTSYYDPPPNYAGVMASAPPSENPTTATPSSTDIPPPPSYADALAMAENKNRSNT